MKKQGKNILRNILKLSIKKKKIKEKIESLTEEIKELKEKKTAKPTENIDYKGIVEKIEKTQEEIDFIDNNLKKFNLIGIEMQCSEEEEKYKTIWKNQLDSKLQELDEEQERELNSMSTSSTLDKIKTDYKGQRNKQRKKSSKIFNLEQKKIREEIMEKKDQLVKEKKQIER